MMLAQMYWKRHCGELLWHRKLVQHFHQVRNGFKCLCPLTLQLFVLPLPWLS